MIIASFVAKKKNTNSKKDAICVYMQAMVNYNEIAFSI